MSVICSRFTQNAWKKDLCSNCFKAKEEHKAHFSTVSKNPDRVMAVPKSIMKGIFSRGKTCKVNFSKDLMQVIGYGGDWNSSEAESEEEVSSFNDTDENASMDDDDEDKELNTITRNNTDFNTSNGNLLGDPADNIKKSFAALRLGTLQLDAEGKKKTLKVSVKPFSSSVSLSPKEGNFNKEKEALNPSSDTSCFSSDDSSSPPIERAMEKSLLEEISETLEKNQKDVKKTHFAKPKKIMFEITSLSGPMPKITTEYKRPIIHSSPVSKEPFEKTDIYEKEQQDKESTMSSKLENSTHYYDVVDSSYNYDIPNSQNKSRKNNKDVQLKTPKISKDQSILSSSQYITDMLLTAKTHSASYSLCEGSFITSKITSDGLIVTKCNSDDTLDSTASSFDGSSDEETSYNMNRSESDSGIGMSIGTDFQGSSVKENSDVLRNSSTNYGDKKLPEQSALTSQKEFNIEKSRELAGEPDGSADPDGNLEASPVSQQTQLHETQTVPISSTQKRPEIPAKPVDVLKTLTKKPQFEQKPNRTSEPPFEISTLSRKEGYEYSKLLRKGRAPNPPNVYSEETNNALIATTDCQDLSNNASKDSLPEQKLEENHSTLYMRNPTVNVKSSSPVIREKDKRERATVNPKFRSLNTCSKKANIVSVSSSEPIKKKLSMSEECLIENKKKKRFSIKKFLRIGTSKTTDNLYKKDGIYSEIIAGDETNIVGKPRLVIIHPIDINPMGTVEVIKEVNKPISSTDINMPIVNGKPPAPPQRMSSDGSKINEINKPARPPPPKSAELRRKQKFGFSPNPTGSINSKMDNVYANLGEIRSAIAPRKPERTASMREREAQLELIKIRQSNEFADTISVCSSKGDSVPSEISLNQSTFKEGKPTVVTDVLQKKQSISTSDLKVKDRINYKGTLRLETFEKPSLDTKPKQTLNDGIRDSVLKINNTVDSYLKDKRQYESLHDICTNSSISEGGYKTHLYSETNLNQNYDFPNTRFKPTCNVGHETTSVTARSEYGAPYELNNFVNIPRAMSTSYCGSEVGETSDIYTPYSCYGSESGIDMCNGLSDATWGIQPMTNLRSKTTNRLRMRKGRSVVHKTIEDNYSAVVVANHEALAQVLDQLQQSIVIPPQLRTLANAINLRFEEFVILDGVQAFVVGKRAFHAAMWMTTPVTLALSSDCNQISGVSGELNQLTGGISGALNPITEFCDLVPSHYLPLLPSTEVRMLQTTVSVLPRMQLNSLHSIGVFLKNKAEGLEKRGTKYRESISNPVNQQEHSSLRNPIQFQSWNEEKREMLTLPGMPSFDDVLYKEVGFIMLQLINGLKNLQAKGIEEIPISLSNVILCQEIDNKETQARLCVLQGSPHDEEESMGTLCKCAYVALNEKLPHNKLTPILSLIFLKDKSETLSKAKSVLEYILWGPSDVMLTGSTKEREQALQRWLDLERATVLHGLVRTKVELTVYDECHLMFLVRSNAKIMNEAFNIVAGYDLNDL